MITAPAINPVNKPFFLTGEVADAAGVAVVGRDEAGVFAAITGGTSVAGDGFATGGAAAGIDGVGSLV
jgi:hypothetical protein